MKRVLARVLLAWWFTFFEVTADRGGLTAGGSPAAPTTRAGFRHWVDCEAARASVWANYPRYREATVVGVRLDPCVEGDPPASLIPVQVRTP